MAIEEFRGKHRFLSNFWSSRVTYDGWSYKSAEHAYQAAKTLDPKERKRIQACVKPGDAKKAGYRITLRPDWEEVKLAIMEEIVREKFQDSYLKHTLMKTGEQELVEGNWWGDRFWGVDSKTGKGENHLGKILMKIRDEIRSSRQSDNSGR